ncbi:MAG: sulfotransferase [Deltaproteobacteria bacterium]|nr:sulfotransferase [Deltaproteobacteria bacterium]MBW2359597.1 sulfotransferase [Deltaproteobacteria bacterium]
MRRPCDLRERNLDPSRRATSLRSVPLVGPAVRALRALRFAGRRLTHGGRALPDFLILGAQKAGTTSLYNHLLRHPRVAPAFTKEVHYFTLHRDEPEAWYRAHFPRVRSLERRGAVTGEATPYYLFEPRAPRRVARVLPEARFVVLLRNPVERAYSHYQHERARGRESLGFAAALEGEEQRLAPELERMASDPTYTSAMHQRQSYFSRGLYAEQLERWRRHYPAERFLILQSEVFFADPAASCARIFEFLELPPHPLSGLRVFNRRAYASLDPQLRAELAGRYAPDKRVLEQLVGARYDWR